MTGVADDKTTRESVKDYYSKVLTTQCDLKTNACCVAKGGMTAKRVRDILAKVPDAVMEKFYGCGSPLPLGIDGLTVLDLGSGSGRDSYVAAALAGPSGRVIGIDMTDEQVQVARDNVDAYAKNLGWTPNLHFVTGYIEDLHAAGIEDASVDLIISNCVVNLSPDKRAVMKAAYACLKNGGEFYFSDVYSSRRIDDSLRRDPVLWGECLSGALYEHDFIQLAREVGFADPRQVSRAPVTVGNADLKAQLGNTQFYSITFRLFKINDSHGASRLEPQCEDYGQVAYYRGNIADSPSVYTLDDHHEFEAQKPVLVCGNTASMLSETWLKPYFTVTGSRDRHFGLFPCGPPTSVAGAGSVGGGCC